MEAVTGSAEGLDMIFSIKDAAKEETLGRFGVFIIQLVRQINYRLLESK